MWPSDLAAADRLDVARVVDEPAAMAERLRELVERYYVGYYRDTLGLPDWRAKVAGRQREEEIEASRIPTVAHTLGRPLRGMRVLNVGCGTGGFNVAVERAGADSWGLDTNPDAVRICDLRRALGGGGRYAVAAAESLPFRAESFDLVYCLSTLEHVADVAATVREMVRVTRPGGAILLYAPNRWALYENHYKIFWPPRCPKPLARLYLRARGRPTRFVDTLNYLSRRRCVALLRAAGATVETLVLAKADQGTPRLTGRLARLYYRLFNVQPAIQLLARKGAEMRR
jgi:2-polyprenyl-3-methyl-5-hydroxy-6-metoxy-1,4-benzoquinol methylase